MNNLAYVMLKREYIFFPNGSKLLNIFGKI